MSDDRGDIQAGLQHAAHLVPGFVHFTTVDTLDDQALEDHFVPVDGSIAGGNTQQGNLAAVSSCTPASAGKHVRYRTFPDLRRSLRPCPVPASRLSGRSLATFTARVAPHLARQVQAVVIHIGDNNVASTYVTYRWLLP